MEHMTQPMSSWKSASNSNFSASTLYLSNGCWYSLAPVFSKSRESETRFLVGLIGTRGFSAYLDLKGLFKGGELCLPGAQFQSQLRWSVHLLLDRSLLFLQEGGTDEVFYSQRGTWRRKTQQKGGVFEVLRQVGMEPVTLATSLNLSSLNELMNNVNNILINNKLIILMNKI